MDLRRSGGSEAICQGWSKEGGGTFICHLFSTNPTFPPRLNPVQFNFWNQVQNYDHLILYTYFNCLGWKKGWMNKLVTSQFTTSQILNLHPPSQTCCSSGFGILDMLLCYAQNLPLPCSSSTSGSMSL